MNKYILLTMLILSSCGITSEERAFNPDYNKYAQHVSIVSTSSDSVVYEYKDIRIDELGALAAQYCDDNGHRQAFLHQILLHKNNSRRAIFICRNN